MSEQDFTADDNSTTNIETVETTENESQANLEADSHEDHEEITPQARAFKEKRREENRQAREALKKVPELEAKIEKISFFKSNPEAEAFEADIDTFRKENPTIPLDKAFRYVLAEKDPIKLAEMTDPGLVNQRKQSRTAPATGDKSYSEQVGEQAPTSESALLAAAQKEWAKQYG